MTKPGQLSLASPCAHRRFKRVRRGETTGAEIIGIMCIDCGAFSEARKDAPPWVEPDPVARER